MFENLARQSGLRKVAKLTERGDAAGLAAMLGHQDAAVTDAAESALVSIGPAAVDPLVAALGRASQDARASAAEVLTMIDDDRALEPLAGVVADVATYGLWPARFLAKRRDPRAVPTLLAFLNDNTLTDVADLLGQTGDARAVQPLLTFLERLEKQQNHYAEISVRPHGERDAAQVAYFRGDLDAGTPIRGLLDGVDENPLIAATAILVVAEWIGHVLQALEQIGTPEANEAVDAYHSRHH